MASLRPRPCGIRNYFKAAQGNGGLFIFRPFRVVSYGSSIHFTCAAPQLPAPCTGCLVHASAMNMPEWRLEVVRDTPMAWPTNLRFLLLKSFKQRFKQPRL